MNELPLEEQTQHTDILHRQASSKAQVKRDGKVIAEIDIARSRMSNGVGGILIALTTAGEDGKPVAQQIHIHSSVFADQYAQVARKVIELLQKVVDAPCLLPAEEVAQKEKPEAVVSPMLSQRWRLWEK